MAILLPESELERRERILRGEPVEPTPVADPMELYSLFPPEEPRPGLLGTFARAAGAAATLGAIEPPQPETFGEALATVGGSLLGFALPYGIASRIAAPIIRGVPFLSRLASSGPVAGAVVPEVVKGALIGAGTAGVGLAKGQEPEEALAAIPREAALFGAFAAGGPILRSIFRRGGAQAARAAAPAAVEIAGQAAEGAARLYPLPSPEERLNLLARNRPGAGVGEALQRSPAEAISAAQPRQPLLTATQSPEIIVSGETGLVGLRQPGFHVPESTVPRVEVPSAEATIDALARFSNNRIAKAAGVDQTLKQAIEQARFQPTESGLVVPESVLRDLKPTPEAQQAVVQELQQAAQGIEQTALQGFQPLEVTPEGVRPLEIRPIRGGSGLPPQVARLVAGPIEPRTEGGRGVLASSFLELGRQAVLAAETWLSGFGEPGQKLAQMLREFWFQAQRRNEMDQLELVPLVQRLRPEARAALRRAIRSGQEMTDPAMRDAAGRLRLYYAEREAEAQQLGLSLVTHDPVTGERVLIPFVGEDPARHFPRRYNWRRIEDLRGEIRQDLIDRLVKEGVFPDHQTARRAIERARRMPHEHIAPWQIEVRDPLPEELELPPLRELVQDIEEGAYRLERARIFGPNDERAHELIDQLPGPVRELARDFFYRVVGPESRGTRFGREVVDALLSYQVMSKLGLAQVPNLFQNLNDAMRAGVVNLIRGALDALRAPRMFEELAARSGVALDPLRIVQQFVEQEGGPALWSERFLRATGFSAVERIVRLVSVATGWQFADDLVRVLREPGSVPWYSRLFGRSPERARRLFIEAGINPDEVVRRGGLTADELERFIHHHVLQTQFPGTPLNVPVWTASPWGKLLFQFKRYAFNQARLLRREVVDETIRFVRSGGRDGSLNGLITVATLFPSAGYLVGLVRDTIAGRDPTTPAELARDVGEALSERDLKKLLGIYADLAAGVGGLGILHDVLTRLNWGEDALISYLLGPNVETARNLLSVLRGTGQALTGPPEEAPQHLATAARGLVRTVLPAPLSYTLARGDVPFAPLIPEEARRPAEQALRRVVQPQRYDPTGRLEAIRTRNEALDRITDAYVRMVATGSPKDREAFGRALQDAYRSGLRLTWQEINQRLQSPRTQLEIARQQLKRARTRQERDALKARIRWPERQIERARLEAVPESAEGLLRAQVP